MKKTVLFMVIVAFALLFMSLKNLSEVLNSLGLSAELANKSIITNLIGVDDFKLPRMKIAPEILTGDKTGTVNEVCSYIKKYCESSTFAADYEKYRQKMKPAESDIQEYDAEQLEEMRQAAKTWEEGSKDKSISKTTRDEYKAMADDMKEGVARAEDPLYDWKKEYPEDPKVLIRKNLEEYLALVNTVDFNAELTQPNKYNKRKFVNPEYESKSLQWKAIYRAGKEANNVATAFAKQWLAGGIKTGQPGFEPQMQPQSGVDKDNQTDLETTSDPKNSSPTLESLKGKTKGMLKSLKDKVRDIP